MKKQIIITVILLIATAFITVVYFKNLNTPGTRTSRVMQTIPGTASLIFEFNNDQGFYDIFNDNKLLAAVISKEKIENLDTLRSRLLQNPLLEKYFTGQNVFVSLHPAGANDIDILLTISALNGFDFSVLDDLSKQQNSGLLITPFRSNGKQGYTIYINAIKKRFFIVNNEDNIFSGSFSKELIDECALYKSNSSKKAFVLLSEQQNDNSLANLYVNYSQLTPLFNQLFKNKNTDIFKAFRLLTGFAALTLNFRSDALMFNGITNVRETGLEGYLNLFANQQPVENHLKDILPSTTAYSINFAVSDPLKFGAGLTAWQEGAGFKMESDQLFKKIKAETGVSLKTAFNKLLFNEFALTTTRYLEKFATVSVKDGSRLKLLMAQISTMTDESSGQLNYDKLPFFLLGDAFSIFKRPYFMIIDNYLVFANSRGELASYYDIYINRKFLSKNEQYNQFDNLLAARSNVAFIIQFKNTMQILKNDLNPAVYDAFENNEPCWKNFYAASCQLTAADKNFYTNFCMKLNTDTTIVNKLK